MSNKLKGKVNWFDPKKGYGFIEKEDGCAIFCLFSVKTFSSFCSFKTTLRLNKNFIVSLFTLNNNSSKS